MSTANVSDFDPQTVLDEADLIASEQQIQQGLDRIASEINRDLADKNPLVLTVMNGGLIVAGQLLPKLNFPLQCDYIHATRYGDCVQGKGLEWRVRPTNDIGGRHLLIIDDIYDEGATLSAIIDECKKYGAKTVTTAMLVDKKHDRKFNAELKVDYVALEAPDRFLFGYGMDYKGYWRNAPGLYAVKGL